MADGRQATYLRRRVAPKRAAASSFADADCRPPPTARRTDVADDARSAAASNAL